MDFSRQVLAQQALASAWEGMESVEAMEWGSWDVNSVGLHETTPCEGVYQHQYIKHIQRDTAPGCYAMQLAAVNACQTLRHLRLSTYRTV